MAIKTKLGFVCSMCFAAMLPASSAIAQTATGATVDQPVRTSPSFTAIKPVHQVYYYPPDSETTEPILVTLSQPPLYSVEPQRAALTTKQIETQSAAKPDPLPVARNVKPLPAIAQPAVVPVDLVQTVNSPLSAPQYAKPLPAIAQPDTEPVNPPLKVDFAPPPEVNLALAPDGTEVKPGSMTLGTRSGIDIGIQESYYRYREPDLDVTELGYMTGFTAQATAVSRGGYSAGLDVRYAFGWLDYRGSGTATGDPNDLWDVRGLLGKDFNFTDFTITPYTGFGYRDLYDDNRGTSSTGAQGYRRENTLYYLPIGINPRFAANAGARIATKLEYDAVLLGQQYSWLSDAGLGDPNVLSMQKAGGSGVRAELMYETANWSFGPFFNYWDIGQSNVKFFQTNNVGLCSPNPTPCTAEGYEPRNHTTEFGMQFRWHFL